jgi:hypothetical protein
MVLVDGRRFLESYLKGCFLLKSVVLIESMMVMMMMMTMTTRREIIVNNLGPAMSSGRSMEYLHQNLVRTYTYSIYREVYKGRNSRKGVYAIMLGLCSADDRTDARSFMACRGVSRLQYVEIIPKAVAACVV